jgi:hypothetical protein
MRLGFECSRPAGLQSSQALPVRLTAPNKQCAVINRRRNRAVAAAAGSAGAPHRDDGDVAGLRLFGQEALAGARQAMDDDMKRQLEDTQAKLRDAERKLVVRCRCPGPPPPPPSRPMRPTAAVCSWSAGGEGAGHGAAAVSRGGAQARRDWRIALCQSAAPLHRTGVA